MKGTVCQPVKWGTPEFRQGSPSAGETASWVVGGVRREETHRRWIPPQLCPKQLCPITTDQHSLSLLLASVRWAVVKLCVLTYGA